MPFYKAILILFAVGSSGSFCWASDELPRNRTAQSQPANGSLIPESVTQEDQKQLAQKALADGKQFESQGTADSLRKALENYEKALGLWRSLKDRAAEGETLDHMGAVYYFLDQRQKALDAFQQELQLRRALGDTLNEAEALNNMGVVYSSLGQEQKSLDSYLQALPLRRAAGDRPGIANTLGNIGMSYLTAGELVRALDYFNQSLALSRELNERPGIANTLNNIGGVYMSWADYRKALEYFGQALEMRRALGQHRQEAMALNNIARVYDLLGDFQKSLDYNRHALELRQTLGNPSEQAASINNIGIVYDSLGEKQKALEYYKQALDLFRASGDRNGEASTLNNIGAFHTNTLGEPQTGLEYHQKALEIRRALGQRIQEASELDNIGFIYNKMKDPRKALDYHRQALEIRRTVGDRLGEGLSLNNMGAAYFSLRELDKSFDYFNQALSLERATESRGGQAITLYGLAQLERDRGNLADAQSRMEESLNIIESMRGKVASQDLRATFLAQKQDYYEFYTDLLMRLHQREPAKGHDIAALQSSERDHARSLLELLAEAKVDIEQGIAPELKQRERVINSRLAWIQKRLIAAYSQEKPDQGKIAPLEEELKNVDAEREKLSMEIRQKHPRYADLQYPPPPELKTIQSLLDAQTLLLEYALGNDNSFLFAVTSNDFVVARLSSGKSIADQVEALRTLLTERPQRSNFGKQVEHSRKLYQELIEPAGKLLSGKRKLIIVPSGILHYLPFEVLLSSGEERTLATSSPSRWPYLVRDYSISYVPSAGVLASLRNRAEAIPVRRKTFLAFADPVYVNDTVMEANLVGSSLRGAFGNERSWKLEPLAETRREVEQIAHLYPKDKVSLLMGEQASEENAKTAGRLNDYRYVHFATHGLLNEARPPYSGLILSLTDSARTQTPASQPLALRGPTANGVSRNTTSNEEAKDGTSSLNARPQSEDGLLQVYEVFNLKLNADLVVLSACETGLGKEVKGEGLIGLTNAFFYAGTPSVMVSLWKVQDRSTADLMVNFYRQLERAPGKTEALRQAKLKLIQDNRYAHPYYWAPFVLVGDPK